MVPNGGFANAQSWWRRYERRPGVEEVDEQTLIAVISESADDEDNAKVESFERFGRRATTAGCAVL